MRPRPYRLAWAAPLLVGASAAIAAEVATGILLYAGPGLMRSLTTVLAVEGAALAAGLWNAPAAGEVVVERLRRRWLFCLVAFMAAGLFGTSWSVIQDLGGGPVGQGLGLAVLAALPLYASGLVLSGMNAVTRDDPAGRLPGPGPAAALGAALGFVITGLLLPRAPIPASLLVACLVLLSAGGMIYGAVLSLRPVVHLRAARPGAGAHVRVEDRVRMSGDEDARFLLENGHVRRRASLEENGSVPWDVTVARSLLDGRPGSKRVLILGGGASALPRTILHEHPDASVDVLERNPAVLELGREHFDTALEEADTSERVRVRVGNFEDLLAEARGPYDLVLVDTAALAPLGGVGGLSRAARAALLTAVAADGALAAGPLRAETLTDPREGWQAMEFARADVDDQVMSIVRPEGAAFPEGPIGDFAPRNGSAPER